MDILVIGAGIVGCAVGYELAARGARVRLLDMRDVGQGATRASAGVLCPHIEGHAAPLLRLGTRSLQLYDGFIDRVRADATDRIEYRRNGTLEVALTDEEAATLRGVAARHLAAGVEHRYLDAGEALEVEPGLATRTRGALLVPVHGYVGVRGLTRALAAAAIARGATIGRPSRVRSVAETTGRVRVTTDDAHADADVVVIAAGSWSGGISVGPVAAPVKPIRGQLLHLRFDTPAASHVIWGARGYLVPWEDGSLLVGATAEDVGFDESATVAGIGDLLDAACEILPAARGGRLDAVRVGLRPATGDEMPIIGRSTSMPRVVYATGHYRNGVLLAPLTAVLVADLVLENRWAGELELTRPDRYGL